MDCMASSRIGLSRVVFLVVLVIQLVILLRWVGMSKSTILSEDGKVAEEKETFGVAKGLDGHPGWTGGVLANEDEGRKGDDGEEMKQSRMTARMKQDSTQLKPPVTDEERAAVARFTAAVNANELVLLKRMLMENKVTDYVEYGMGGSTRFAGSIPSIQRITSVDTSLEWIQNVQRDPEVKGGYDSGRIKLVHIDLGPLAEWGNPANEDRRDHWPEYCGVIHGVEPAPQLVYVDGRFRVSCVLEAVGRLGTSAVIVVHDFWDRPQYHIVLELTNVLASSDRMVALRKRTVTFNETLFNLLRESYRYVKD